MNLAQNSSSTFPRTYLITIIAMSLGILNHITFLSLFYKYDITPLYYYNYVSIFLFIALLFVVLKKKTVTLVLIIAAIEIMIHQFIAIKLVGWEYGFQYYIIAIPGLILLADFRRRSHPVLFSILSFIFLIFLYFYSLSNPASYQMEAIKSGLYLFNLMSVTALVAVFSGLFAFTSKQSEKILLNAHEQLYITATTDSMTELPNRMKTFELLEDQLVRSKRSEKYFTLALADIDNFKLVNDTHGHDAGDAVITTVAHLMKNSLREQDIVGRWGGEEFMIVLPDTDIHDGKVALEKLLKNIANNPIMIKDISINITITLGVASSNYANTIDEIIKLADNALYEGKRETKNCIVLSSENLLS